jgi:hypothetical protein
MLVERPAQDVAPGPAAPRGALHRLDIKQPSIVGVRERVSDAAK